jgi:quinol monooxygenase YgiN
MIVLLFRIRCRPGAAERAEGLLRDVIAPSRELDGVVSFDIGRDISDGDAFVATEVFDDERALERQESLAEVARVMEAMPDLLAEPPEETVFHVASAGARG